MTAKQPDEITRRDVMLGYVGDPRDADPFGHKAKYRINHFVQNRRKKRVVMCDIHSEFDAYVVRVTCENKRKFLMGVDTGTLFTLEGKCLGSSQLNIVA